jgi:hypothetical protein
MRMKFVSLQLVVWTNIGICIIQTNDQSQVDEMSLSMINESAAIDIARQ